MVIDMHVHPILFGPICEDKEKVEFRKQEFGLYKSSSIPMSILSITFERLSLVFISSSL